LGTKTPVGVTKKNELVLENDGVVKDKISIGIHP